MNGEQIKVDYASSTVTYVGIAHCGATATEEAWAIKKITTDSNGKLLSLERSLGTLDRVNKWSERATITYK